MFDSRPGVQQEDSRRTMLLCSKCALISCGIIIAIIALQALTGTILAVKVCAAAPAEEAARDSLISSFRTLRWCHSFLGHFIILPAFLVLAVSTLFTLSVSGFKTRHTKRSWVQLTRGLLMVGLVVSVAMGGDAFHRGLKAAGVWLFQEASSAESAIGITSWQAFYTFIALHGIVLPFLVIILIIFMWPALDEFLRGTGPESLSKWAVFEQDKKEIKEEEFEDLPAGWGAMSKAADKAASDKAASDQNQDQDQDYQV